MFIIIFIAHAPTLWDRIGACKLLRKTFMRPARTWIDVKRHLDSVGALHYDFEKRVTQRENNKAIFDWLENQFFK